MRFIHTSDWHLGRAFHQVGLLGAQQAYLDHLVETVRSEGVDAVLVAEGVETPEELAALSALGFDAAQGYHLGRPAPLADALAMGSRDG